MAYMTSNTMFAKFNHANQHFEGLNSQNQFLNVFSSKYYFEGHLKVTVTLKIIFEQSRSCDPSF